MAQSKDVRLVTEAKLDVSQATALAPIKNDVADLKTVAGLAPGDVNDATAANLIETVGTETHTALSAAIEASPRPSAVANAAMMRAVNRVRRFGTVESARPYVLIVGQSNAQGFGYGWDADIDVMLTGLGVRAGGGVDAGKVTPAKDPLYHVGQVFATDGSPLVGPAMEFARQWITTELANRDVVIIPAAQGSTSFTGNATYSWDPDNTTAAANLYSRSVQVTNTALLSDPNGYLAGIVFLMGESDAILGATKAWYKSKLIQMIDGYRAAFGPVPFLIGSMVPEWVASTGAPAQNIQAAQQEIAAELDMVAWVQGPTDAKQDEDIHYTAAGAREMGRRLYAAYAAMDKTPPTLDGSAGALMKIDAAQLAPGVGAQGATITNLAATTAQTLTGGSEVDSTVTIIGTPSFSERTPKGGLHLFTSTASTEYRLSWPEDVQAYIQANHTHKFFVNLWVRTTSIPSLAETSVLPVDLATPTVFGINVRGASVRPDTTEKAFAGTTLMQSGFTRLTALIDPGDISGTLNNLRGLWRNASGFGGQVLYRLDLIDQTVDGRSYSELNAASQAEYNRDFGIGGKYAGDTFTTPA